MTGMAGAFLGFLGVILGALGAHALEGVLGADHLNSFKTGVHYLQWHGSLLLILGFVFPNTGIPPLPIRCAILFMGFGVFLFSGSILGLVLLPLVGMPAHFLGPITPIGGLTLLAGWLSLFLFFIQQFKIKYTHGN